MSMPTGEENFALLDAFNQHGYQGMQGGSGSMGSQPQHHIMKRSYGRGGSARRIAAGGQGARAGRQQRSTGQTQQRRDRGKEAKAAQGYRTKEGSGSQGASAATK